MAEILNSLAYALTRAMDSDLPNVKDRRHVYKSESGSQTVTWEEYERRPHEGEVEVYHFPQLWDSTALGFGGVGGQAFTTAYTTVVISNPAAAVYFGGRLAYKIAEVNSKFMADVHSGSMAAKGETSEYRS